MSRSLGFSVRGKLSIAELRWLKDTFGIELNDPEHLMAIEDLERSVESLNRLRNSTSVSQEDRKEVGSDRWCSYCGDENIKPGEFAESPRGTLICQRCAIAAVSLMTRESGAT